MRKISNYLLFATCVLLLAACGTDYKTTKSGLKYKIFADGKSSDKVVKAGDVLKLTYTQKINDSILETNVGKMPVYFPLQLNGEMNYDPTEVLQFLRKGRL